MSQSTRGRRTSRRLVSMQNVQSSERRLMYTSGVVYLKACSVRVCGWICGCRAMYVCLRLSPWDLSRCFTKLIRESCSFLHYFLNVIVVIVFLATQPCPLQMPHPQPSVCFLLFLLLFWISTHKSITFFRRGKSIRDHVSRAGSVKAAM